MKQFKLFVMLSITFFTISLMQSCAPSTQMAGSWQNKEFNGKINKILVLGIAKQDWGRKVFEYTLRDAFIDYGIESMATLDVITVDHKIAKETFKKYFNDKNIDAVIVSRVIGVDQKQTQVYNDMYTVPFGYYNSFGSFYFNAYDYIYNPGYSVTSETVRIESNLYSAEDGKLIWSGISESVEPDDAFDLIESVSDVIVKELNNLKIIQK